MARSKNLGALLAADDEVSAQPVERTVRIVLEENENIPPTGQFIACNGRTFMLRAGDEADVPAAVLNVLNAAVQDVPQIDPATKQVVGYRRKLRFPYRVVAVEPA